MLVSSAAVIDTPKSSSDWLYRRERGQATRRPLFYATVAGDIIGTFRWWRVAKRDPSQVAVTYSAQFFDLCRALGRPGLATGEAESAAVAQDADIAIVMHAAHPSSGWRFHMRMLARAFANVRDIRRADANAAIVMDGAGYWFPLALARGRGRRLFLSIHTTLWHDDRRSRLLRRLILVAEGWFLRRHCAGVLVVSEAIARQVTALAGPAGPPIRLFKPTYSAADFEGAVPADPAVGPFVLLYAGRIEAAKGVFDLVATVKLLLGRGHDVRLVICGEGPALPALRERIAEEGLADSIDCLGHQTRSDMLALLAASHCVVVPTRSDFPEGLNKVVIEAVLARRPVVTSRVCPALDEVGPAVVEAEPDDPESYARAIAALVTDPALYRAKVAAGADLVEGFTDVECGWRAQAEALLAHTK